MAKPGGGGRGGPGPFTCFFRKGGAGEALIYAFISTKLPLHECI